MQSLLATMGFYPSGNGLNDVLTPPEMTALGKTLADEGIPENAAHLLRPWFAGIALAIPPCEKRRAADGLLPLDKLLEHDAVAQGKQVVGLETMALQLRAMAAMPEGVQVAMLKASVGTLALRNDLLEAMHGAYLRRDLATSVPLTKLLVERAGYDPAAVDAFEHELATKRNYGMRDAALPLLRRGEAFIAVGGMHLLGKEGLVELFRAAGYTVTPVE